MGYPQEKETETIKAALDKTTRVGRMSTLYLMNADGTNQQNLTNTSGEAFDFDPDFSPNGKNIAYESFGEQSSNTQGDEEIYLMKADGSKQRNNTNTGSGIDDIQPDFGEAKKK